MLQNKAGAGCPTPARFIINEPAAYAASPAFFFSA